MTWPFVTCIRTRKDVICSHDEVADVPRSRILLIRRRLPHCRYCVHRPLSKISRPPSAICSLRVFASSDSSIPQRYRLIIDALRRFLPSSSDGVARTRAHQLRRLLRCSSTSHNSEATVVRIQQHRHDTPAFACPSTSPPFIRLTRASCFRISRRKMGKEKASKKDSVPITRDYTIDLHKRLHGMYVITAGPVRAFRVRCSVHVWALWCSLLGASDGASSVWRSLRLDRNGRDMLAVFVGTQRSCTHSLTSSASHLTEQWLQEPRSPCVEGGQEVRPDPHGHSRRPRRC